MLVVVLFFGGILEGFMQSIGLHSLGVVPFTLKFYKEVIISTEFWESFFLTARIAIISTLISSLLGMWVIVCLFLIRKGEKREKTLLMQRLFQIPMLFPYLIAAYFVFFMLGQSGWIARVLVHMGIIQKMGDFPVIVNDSFGWGIIFTYVWKTTPFVVLMLYPVILQIYDSWIEVGRVFGANPFKFFRAIVFPLLISPWKTSAFIILSYTALAFEVPYLLGVTYPKALSVYSYEIYMNGNLTDRPKAMVINIILTMMLLVVGWIFYLLGNYKFSKLWTSKKMKGL
jgi:putative spermidine/putrescine transport system permease protein